MSDCCTPGRGPGGPVRTDLAMPAPAAPDRARGEFVELPGGRFAMGDSFGEGYAADGELPVHAVRVSPFAISPTTVSNAGFAEFVRDTGYVTDAERFGSSAVFWQAVAAAETDRVRPIPGVEWWIEVRGADWAHPGGRRSSWRELPEHPAVHVSWFDAQAYCRWSGTRLPTEAEWEYAARGGHGDRRFPWGDELEPDGSSRCNVWQGVFPTQNTQADGYLATAPARCYQPNDYGVYQTSGNVWEWCADWFAATYYAVSPEVDPAGPARGSERVLRGGSYLCHASYCSRYRLAARHANTPDSSAGNTGFRVVADRELL